MSRRRLKVVLYGETGTHSTGLTEQVLLEAVTMNAPNMMETPLCSGVRIRWNQRLSHAKEVCICCDEDCGNIPDGIREELISGVEKAIKHLSGAMRELKTGTGLDDPNLMQRLREGSVCAEIAADKLGC